MSHHFDYPEPRLDITDVWCFGGTTGTVLVINIDPKGDSGFHPEGLYEFKTDTDDDAVEDLTLRARFPFDGAGDQQLRVELLTGEAAGDRDAAGEVITPADARPEQIITCSNGIRLFAGRRGEPFFNDPRLLFGIKDAMDAGAAPDLAGFDPGTSQNAFTGDINAIVVEVPDEIIGTGTIGFWGTTALEEHGTWHQVQHAAGPVVGLLWDMPDFNASHPKDQQAMFGATVAAQTAAVVEAMGTFDDPPNGRSTPEEYGRYVRDSVLPDVLRYEVGSTAHYGPRTRNGKGLTDPALESIFELILNKHLAMGLGTDDTTGTLLDQFPYLSEPTPAE